LLTTSYPSPTNYNLVELARLEFAIVAFLDTDIQTDLDKYCNRVLQQTFIRKLVKSMLVSKSTKTLARQRIGAKSLHGMSVYGVDFCECGASLLSRTLHLEKS